MRARERALVIAAVAVFLLVVVVAATRLGDDGTGPHDPADRRPPAPEPTADASRPRPARPATELPVDRSPGCAALPVAPVPIADRAEQLAVVREALAVQEIPFEVVLAGPTRIGVVAVVEGDATTARAALPDVPHVVPLSLPLAALGDDHEAQLAWVMSALLDPGVRAVDEQVRGLSGRHAVTSWPAGGAVVVSWAPPVPRAVRRLDGTRVAGAPVVVLEMPRGPSRCR